ncbi:2-oxoglutarate-Fe(II)-dependent oxygenase superfamily protein [Tepidamorphus gemmatus]|jgi:SM-20-related protein|uniref:2-oxoglutarate-Fe(II)-dependent oxygenase superfamily protein n=1 Tax=Tepidamorphus gemmatus TaxID=747076 RepID=A0A4R3MLK7_9HYPH|nr:2OG-Fe(II) oxygenase [Tepidamorphus gemmatus]TCT13688.1 2-oxoglutarate-Fe(II)-dependent oxygenase superfamily protein [Tepidamorphus gemmatus]
MSLLDYDALRATELQREPYDWLIVPDFIRPDAFESIVADYPRVPGPGSHPPSELDIRGRFAELMAELDGPAFRELIEQKFGIDLSDKPTMYTVRGFCRKSDGKIHTDSETKIITVLLYMNQRWDADGGRLRILRNGTDLDDYVAEVPPHGGTLLVFRRSDNSWHGHEPFEGQRRAVQMNWVTSADVVSYEQRRHRISSTLKKLNPRNWRASA